MSNSTFSERFIRLVRAVLPTPFTIAILLTVLALLWALIATFPADSGLFGYLGTLSNHWYDGMWNGPLLEFAVQMMLMLVLGHVLALSRPIDNLISHFTTLFCKNTMTAAYVVTLLTIGVALFNWGLGLIFGAIFARKVGEQAASRGWKLNYPLIGAAGYSGLMVWHGGFSGSSLAKVAQEGHIKQLMAGQIPQEQIDTLPEVISYDQTVFGEMNLAVTILLIVIVPVVMRAVGKRSDADVPRLRVTTLDNETEMEIPSGADKLDRSKWFGTVLGGLILLVFLYKAFTHPRLGSLGFIDPNWINLGLLGLALFAHRRINAFLHAVDEAIGGAAGILIQFPLYFGIMGIMKGSGLVTMMSDFFISISNETTYPIFTFISAGIVNVFVPSGGGQWAVQGPIIVQAAGELGVPLSKSILAMAYGDQLTNMLQPFWALPLLGITGLKAKEILPYTLLLMLVGTVIFVTGLLLF